MKTTKNRKRKRVVNTAALGVSLLLSSTLLVGNAVSVYASPTISTDEQNAIDAFLATQPTDGATRNIGTTNPTVTPSTYTFPGANNYVSVFRDPSGDMRLSQDAVYTCAKWSATGVYTYINVKIKDWSTIDWYRIKNTPEYEQHYIDYGRPIEYRYFAKEITVIDQSDNSEITYHYPVLVDNGSYLYLNPYYLTGGEYGNNLNAGYANIPIEADDPRFKFEIMYPYGATYYLYNLYWTFIVPIEEQTSYDTIVKIDESLKTNEAVVTEGDYGKKAIQYGPGGYLTNPVMHSNLDNLFKQYTADVIYDMMKTDFDNVNEDGAYIENEFGWGAYSGELHITPKKDRIIRVGIDYTHYVTDDGTVLKPTTYGLNPVDTIAGYQFVSSHREANGDLVHVYTVPSATTPSTPATPATGAKTNVFSSAIAMISAIFVGAITLVKRNKRV